MKVEELMVGNIFGYIDEDKLVPVVVMKIDGQSDIVCLRQSDGHIFNTMIDFLLPIIITDKILEHNGFEPDGPIYRWTSGECEVVYWTTDSYLEAQNPTYDSEIDMPCRSVDRLQNALKICKIDKKITLP